MRRRKGYNPKRALLDVEQVRARRHILDKLAAQVSYGGNPEHKRNPGDFGLVPPAAPRRGKTLCDEVLVFSRVKALELLRSAFRVGLLDLGGQAKGGRRSSGP